MPMTFITSKLKSIGLSAKQIEVYLYLLEAGQATAKQIYRQTNMTKVTAYKILDELVKLNLISVTQLENAALYICESPTNLDSVVKQKYEGIKRLEHNLESIIIELNSRYRKNINPKPVVRLHEGTEGFLISRKDIVDTKPDKVYEIANIDQNVFGEDISRRDYVKQNIHFDVIYTSKKGPILPQEEKLKTRTYIPYEKYPNIKSDIIIYNNKVALSSYLGKKMEIIIEDQDIADTFREIFHILKSVTKKSG